MIYVELFMEDIPQMFVQSINNTQTNDWDALAIISLLFSIFSVVSMIGSYVFVDEDISLDLKSNYLCC